MFKSFYNWLFVLKIVETPIQYFYFCTHETVEFQNTLLKLAWWIAWNNFKHMLKSFYNWLFVLKIVETPIQYFYFCTHETVEFQNTLLKLESKWSLFITEHCWTSITHCWIFGQLLKGYIHCWNQIAIW